MKKVVLGLTAATVMLTSGCATILNEDTQNINVRTSNNTAVKLSVDGEQITTPASVTVKRADKPLLIETANEKCASTTSVDSEVDGNFYINILSGGAFGSTTDYSSGKMWSYDSDVVVNCNN